MRALLYCFRAEFCARTMDREGLGESEGIPWRRNSLGEFARVFSKKFLFMRSSLCVCADSIYKRPLTRVHLVLAAQKTTKLSDEL